MSANMSVAPLNTCVTFVPRTATMCQKSAISYNSKSIADEGPPKVAGIDLGETGL